MNEPKPTKIDPKRHKEMMDRIDKLPVVNGQVKLLDFMAAITGQSAKTVCRELIRESSGR